MERNTVGIKQEPWAVIVKVEGEDKGVPEEFRGESVFGDGGWREMEGTESHEWGEGSSQMLLKIANVY